MTKASNPQFDIICDEISSYDQDYSQCYRFFSFETDEHPHGWISAKERSRLFAAFLKRALKNDCSAMFGRDPKAEKSKMSDAWKGLMYEFANDQMSDHIDSSAGENTGAFFRNPKLHGESVLIRFSDFGPGAWRGHEPFNLGLTCHESSGDGTLSFAYMMEDIGKDEYESLRSNYGSRVWKIWVPECLSVEHVSDSGPRQVIFDLEDVGKVKEIVKTVRNNNKEKY